jgi:hypothetical protein
MMELYISNLIPRLIQFSANLDKKEIFIEKPWVIVDDNLDQQKYIFKRDGVLIMSLNGQVTVGKWEYISAARCLLIDRIRDKILLNQNFIDPAVMILKKDGFKDEILILANEILIPDLNVVDYLKRLYFEKNKIVAYKLINGDFLEISNYQGSWKNLKVSIEGDQVPDGKYEIENSARNFLLNERIVLVKDCRIIKVFIQETYDTNKGKIVIEQEEYKLASKGDLVFQNNLPAPNGKYRLGFMSHITVEDGRII